MASRVTGDFRKNEFTVVPLTARVIELDIGVSYKNGSDVRLRTVVAVGRKGGRLCVSDSSQMSSVPAASCHIARASQEWSFPGFFPVSLICSSMSFHCMHIESLTQDRGQFKIFLLCLALS